MNSYGGFIYRLENAKDAEEIRKRINDVGFFADALALGDMHPEIPEISLIALGEYMAFTHAALMTPKKEAGSIRHMMAFSNCITLPTIAFDEIRAKMGLAAWSKVNSLLTYNGRSERFPSGLWEALIETLKELRPDVAHGLDHLDNLRQHGHEKKFGHGFDMMTLEKDALGTFLEIAGFDRKKELNVMLPGDQPAPFLRNVVGCKVLEATMITHDMLVLGGALEHFKSYQVGFIEYQKSSGGKLTVMNVNNTDIEHTLGVDAVLYDHRFHSYLMVQFKRMTAETTRDIGYRLTEDDKCQIQRMEQFDRMRHTFAEEAITEIDYYRLHPGCFYLKLCAPESYTPLSPELIRGIYLPLDFWPVLLSSPQVQVSEEGRRISYNNCRYLNNTLFSELAQYGWIGSKQHYTDRLTDELAKIIQLTLDAKKSAMIGEIRG